MELTVLRGYCAFFSEFFHPVLTFGGRHEENIEYGTVYSKSWKQLSYVKFQAMPHTPYTPQPSSMSPATQTAANPESANLENKTSEERIQLALAAIHSQGLRENGNPKYSLRAAATDFSVSKSTLTARYNGRQTRQAAHEKEKKLPKAAEEVLVEWIKEKGRRNIPLSPAAVAEHASSILGGTEIGESWVRRFRASHPELAARWTTGLEKCRAQALNPATLADFQDTYEELVQQYSIKPKNLYNADEKGIQLGVAGRILALVDRDQKNVQKVEDGNRDLVTMMECVAADGWAMPPCAIYPGVRRDLSWGAENPCNARYCYLPSFH